MSSRNSKGEVYGSGRTRCYATLVYPDSAPADWRDRLASCFVPVFISPLHDQDINPDGELKKPHYHVLLMFDSMKTTDQAKEIFDQIGGVGVVRVNSLRGYARYLCHLDNPEKHIYSENDVASMCGADYSATISLASDKYTALGDMQDFCEKYNIVSFYILSKYARNHRPDWYRILCDSGAVYMREYLKSKQWSAQASITDIVDPETGEIIT